MQLSDVQIRDIESRQLAEYVGRLVRELRAEPTEEVSRLRDEELFSLVSSAVGKARKYGILNGEGIRRYVRLAVLVDPTFDQLPAVQAFLRLSDIEPDLKIKLLSDLTAAQLRARVS